MILERDKPAIDALLNAGLAPELEAALRGDVIGAGIVTQKSHPDYTVGSDLYNLVTAGMGRLSRLPRQELAENPIEVPEKTSNLGKIACGLVNDSLIPTRAGGTYPRFSQDQAIDKIDSSELVEERFAIAIGAIDIEDTTLPNPLSDTDINIKLPSVPHAIGVDKDINPVFLLKENGYPSAMALCNIIINGVVIPPGTHLHVIESPDLLTAEVDGFEVFYANSRNIDQIGPQRILKYGFDTAHRASYFKRRDKLNGTVFSSEAYGEPEKGEPGYVDGYKYPMLHHDKVVAELTLDSFRKRLPSERAIRQALRYSAQSLHDTDNDFL